MPERHLPTICRKTLQERIVTCRNGPPFARWRAVAGPLQVERPRLPARSA